MEEKAAPIPLGLAPGNMVRKIAPACDAEPKQTCIEDRKVKATTRMATKSCFIRFLPDILRQMTGAIESLYLRKLIVSRPKPCRLSHHEQLPYDLHS